MLGLQTGGKARWWLVDRLQLNQRPGWCWARVVSWIYYGSWRGLRTSVLDDEYSNRGCMRDAAMVGACYCGKFATVEFAEQAELINPITVPSSTEVKS